MSYTELKREVYEANMELQRRLQGDNDTHP